MEPSQEFVDRYTAHLKARWVNRTDFYNEFNPDISATFYDRHRSLSEEKLRAAASGQTPIALFPTSAGGCLWAALDIDNKDKKSAVAAKNEVNARKILAEHAEYHPLVIKTNSWGGFHILFFFAAPQPLAGAIGLVKKIAGDKNNIELVPRDRRLDGFPNRYTAIKIPAKHIYSGEPAAILSPQDEWLEWGTLEFIELLETYQGVSDPDLPRVASSSSRPLKAAQPAAFYMAGSAEDDWKQNTAPGVWRGIHEITLRNPGPHARAHVLTEINRIPCGDCRNDSLAYVRTNPIPTKPEEQFAWGVGFHNYVRRKQSKSEMTVDEARPLYEAASQPS